jgi:hypothetical protein
MIKEVFNNFVGGVFVGFVIAMSMTALLFGYGSMPTSMIREGVVYINDRAFQIKELK